MLDLGIDLNLWPWVWLGVAVFFALIELTVLAGSFVLLPFAASALVAALLGFYDVAIEIQWLVFVGGGALMWVAALPVRQERSPATTNSNPASAPTGWSASPASSPPPIDPDDTDRRGRVTAHGEVWGATSENGTVLPQGTHVRIVAVSGTKVIVESTDVAPPTDASHRRPYQHRPAATAPPPAPPT